MKCPLCDEIVEKFQTNSHIVPRWMLKAIKENGQYILMEKNVNRKEQSDPVGDFFCEKCENRCTKFDTFSTKFFRHNKFEKFRKSIPGVQFPYIVYKDDCKNLLWLFIASVVLRAHLYMNSINQGDLLGENYEDLKSLFIEKKADWNRFPVIVSKFNKCDGIVFFPYSTNDNGYPCIDMMLFGFRIYFFTDSGKCPLSYYQISNFRDLWVPNVPHTAKLYEDLMKRTEKGLK